MILVHFGLRNKSWKNCPHPWPLYLDSCASKLLVTFWNVFSHDSGRRLLISMEMEWPLLPQKIWEFGILSVLDSGTKVGKQLPPPSPRNRKFEVWSVLESETKVGTPHPTPPRPTIHKLLLPTPTENIGFCLFWTQENLSPSVRCTLVCYLFVSLLVRLLWSILFWLCTKSECQIFWLTLSCLGKALSLTPSPGNCKLPPSVRTSDLQSSFATTQCFLSGWVSDLQNNNWPSPPPPHPPKKYEKLSFSTRTSDLQSSISSPNPQIKSSANPGMVGSHKAPARGTFAFTQFGQKAMIFIVHVLLDFEDASTFVYGVANGTVRMSVWKSKHKYTKQTVKQWDTVVTSPDNFFRGKWQIWTIIVH